MKKHCFLYLSILLAINLGKAQGLTPIDRAYRESLPQFSQNIQQLTKHAWPEMQIGPYCIFRMNGPAFITNHPNFDGINTQKDSIYCFESSEYGLFGATQSLIKDAIVAHCDYGQQYYTSINSFHAELYHELHHSYQRMHVKGLKFDNPADMMTYPENAKNDAIKIYENEVLLDLAQNPEINFQQKLNLFYTCRNLRKETIGDRYFTYEKAVESVEGPATYCEYMYMKQFGLSMADQAYIQHKYFYSLIEPNYGREALRSKYLLTGMAQCIILSKFFPGWQNEYYASGQYLNDFFFLKFKPQTTTLPSLSYYESKAKHFTMLAIKRHHDELTEFNNQNGIRITLNFERIPNFKGFDPMHAQSVTDNLILHNSLLKLGMNNNQLNIFNHRVLTTIKDQVWFVKQLAFYVDDSNIDMSNNRIRIKLKNIDIEWEFKSVVKEKNGYYFTL